jgi:hypothetical protein
MSVGPVASISVQQFFTQRTSDMNQLRQALMSGDLTGAQNAYNAIVSLGKQGPLANGAPFAVADRESDFQAIGTALQAGDLTSALNSLQAIHQSFLKQYGPPVKTDSSSAGPAAVVNLSGSH